MNSKSLCLVAVGILAATAAQAATEAALPFISPMFSDNMVLQREKTNTFWGWAKPGDEVRVEVAGKNASGKAAADGRWQVQIAAPPVGGPYAVQISGPQKVSFTNVLVGDVWLCGGQSNMEWPLARTQNGSEAIKAANFPNIRLFTVKQQPGYAPKWLVQGSWKVCTPKTITEDGGFSAVGYYFARKVQSETNVPIGLIKDCWGGTPAESWTSVETLRTSFKTFDSGLAEIDRLHAKGAPEYGNYISHWYEEYDRGQNENWFAATLNDQDWKTVTLPDGFRDLGVSESPSVCYFRKSIVLTEPLPAGRVQIHLGVIDKMDTVHVNGRWVGASAWVENPRVYDIPGGTLKPGTNVVAVRVFKIKADGGFRTPEQVKLVLGDKTEISLSGEWKGKVSVDAKPPHSLPVGFENWPTMPAVLYNGMIHPVAPFGLCGAIWYQGESNVGRSEQYKKLLPAMIADWRRAFQQGDFPFYVVSLAAYLPRRDAPGDDSWAELREAQDFVARTVKNSGLSVTIDVGDANDIHPQDKKTVGERLALCALAKHYGRKIACSGPTLASVEKRPGSLKLLFENTDGGLVVKGDRLGEFSVAGEDRKWFWADAKIDGDAVVVSSAEVAKPVFVRYAWQANPVATLFNGAGLPAVPFRTDGTREGN